MRQALIITRTVGTAIVLLSFAACVPQPPPPPPPPPMDAASALISGTVFNGSGAENIPFNGGFTVECVGLNNNYKVYANILSGGRYVCTVSPGQDYRVRASAKDFTTRNYIDVPPGSTKIDFVLTPSN